MKTLEDFTPKIQAKIPSYIERALEGVFDGERYEKFNIESAAAAVNWNYEKCGYKKPTIIVAENILEQQLLFNYLKNNEELRQLIQLLFNFKNEIPLNEEIKILQLDSQLYSQLDSQLYNQLYNQLDNQLDSQLHSQLDSQLEDYNNSYLFTLNVYSDCFYSWYKFIKEEFKLSLTIEKDFEECFKLQRESNIYSAIFSEAVCVVCKYPKKVYRDEQNRLHNTRNIAVEWGYLTEATKCEYYFLHGRNIPSDVFLKCNNGLITKKDFINEQNEDIKAGIYEIIEANKGEGSMLSVLGAEEVDKQIIKHKTGSETLILYKTKELFEGEEDLKGKSPAALAWLKMTCPSTGTNYLIPTDSSFNSVIDAAKYHRPTFIPKELSYCWDLRN